MNPVLLASLANPVPTPTEPPLPPNEKKVILVFDTETSGLFPKAAPPTECQTLDAYPFVLQLSFVLFEVQSRKVLHKYNRYINVPEHVVISPFITNLTGITREMCDGGVSIVSALHELYRAYKLCDIVVAHNVSFDQQMIEIEVIRNFATLSKTIPMVAFIFNNILQKMENKQVCCTMALGKNVCNIMVPSKTNPACSYKKNPKLEELYEHLFHEKMPNAHDALYDTLACMRCFVKMKYDIDVEVCCAV